MSLQLTAANIKLQSFIQISIEWLIIGTPCRVDLISDNSGSVLESRAIGRWVGIVCRC